MIIFKGMECELFQWVSMFVNSLVAIGTLSLAWFSFSVQRKNEIEQRTRILSWQSWSDGTLSLCIAWRDRDIKVNTLSIDGIYFTRAKWV